MVKGPDRIRNKNFSGNGQQQFTPRDRVCVQEIVREKERMNELMDVINE
jgi:hypothetical protein